MRFNKRLMTYDLRLTTIFLVLLVISHQSLVSNAQTPAQVLLTWQANNFYPADYAGKALATKNTQVNVSAEVVRGGRFINLSGATFLWYVDEKLVGRGEGLKEINFTATKPVGDSHFVRISIQSGEDVFESSIRVPVSNPAVVLETPYPNGLVRSGTRPEITAVPYFFNVGIFQNLNFFWQVGTGTTQESGNDNRLFLTLGGAKAGEVIQVTGTARNANNLIETATSRIRLVVY
ncbi:MAG: hypothetical protein HY378_01755 [Candidatus Brennerbacteria bacterium]|nr:hypothetical protein [Candidatus Brennerbacteria bacterium]